MRDRDVQSNDKFQWDMTTWMVIVLVVAVVIFMTAELWWPHFTPHLRR